MLKHVLMPTTGQVQYQSESASRIRFYQLHNSNAFEYNTLVVALCYKWYFASGRCNRACQENKQ